MNKIQNHHTLKQNPFRLLDPAVLVIAILPWLLLAVHPNWVFPGLNFDALFSWGLYYIYDIKIPLTGINSSHYFGRLGTILPGYLVFHIMPTLWATYALNLGYWYITVFSVYFTVNLMLDKRTALFTAILMGCYPLLLSAFSAGFNDGPGVCYMALTILFLTLAIKKHFWWMWLFMSGISFAGAVHSNFFVLCFVPVFAVYYIFINRETNKKGLGFSFLFVILGFAAFTFVLGTINFFAGGQFLFFLSSIKAALHYGARSSAENPAYQPLYLTLLKRHLVMPNIIFIGSLVFLWVNRTKNLNTAERLAHLFQIMYILTMSIYLFWEVRGGVSVLWYPEYVGFLLPIMFLAFGAQLVFIASSLHQKSLWGFVGYGVIIMLLCRIMYLIPGGTFITSIFRWDLTVSTYKDAVAILLLVTTAVTLLYGMQSRFPKQILVIIILFTGIIYADMPNSLGQRFSKKQLMAMDKGRRIIMNTPPYISQQRQRFWLDESSLMTPVYKAVAGIFGGYYDFFKWPDPEFEKMQDTFKLHSVDWERGRPKSGENLLILTDKPDVLDKAQMLLNKIGLTADWIKTEKIEEGSVQYFMTFIKVEDYVPK